MTPHPTERPLFPLLFISGWLMAFYARVLQGQRPDRGALPLLLKSWWLGPRVVPFSGMQRAGVHSYAFALEEDFCCDEKGRSTLMLLEDGKPLPYPHTTAVKSISSQGLGRWVHIGRKIFFSPGDNADLAKTPRQYLLVDGLGSNPEIFDALSKLAKLRPSFANPAAYALAKLQLCLGKRLKLGGMREIDARHLAVDELSLALAGVFLPDLSLTRVALAVEAEAATSRLHATLEGVRWGALRLDSLDLALEIDPDYRPRLTALTATAQGEIVMELATTWQDGEWQDATLKLARLTAPRRELATACGGPDACVRWLDGFLADLATGALAMGLALSDESVADLRAAWAPDGDADTLTLDLARSGTSLRLATRTA